MQVGSVVHGTGHAYRTKTGRLSIIMNPGITISPSDDEVPNSIHPMAIEKKRKNTAATGVLCRFFKIGKECPALESAKCPFRHFWNSDKEQDEVLSSLVLQKRSKMLGDTAPVSEDLEPKWMRAEVFAAWVNETFFENGPLSKTDSLVLDVAGGKGMLSYKLQVNHGIRRTMVIDPRVQKLPPKKAAFLAKLRRDHATDEDKNADYEIPRLGIPFDAGLIERPSSEVMNCGLVLGLHPDQATEAIVDFALQYKKHFAVVPCCVFACEFPQRIDTRTGKAIISYRDFIQYLQEKSGGALEPLQFEGKNLCLSSSSMMIR
eukprot:TRINITY_DN70900_c0_g2_i2.p1 TRINITY_DN70900_c0_g2~~TRINITY_DN70900_c0_g2_i2.p1  ORF type:complete len:318 (-),score=76.14 TRINITY_DN70900_c0_g2_i2:111-1064(-)